MREGASGISIVCGLASEQSVVEAFATLRWDRVDLLVNNGGWIADNEMALTSLSLDDWNRMIGSHLMGAVLISRAAAAPLTT